LSSSEQLESARFSRPPNSLKRVLVPKAAIQRMANCQPEGFTIEHVNFLRSSRRRPAAGGDSPPQLRHRAEFLDASHLDAVTTTIVARVERSSPERILDAGSGTGHHLARIAARLPGSVTGLGLDISKDVARLVAQRWPSLAFVVADLWAEWPVHDAAIDLVVSIFAPKNFPETARVLRPGGCLALVYPGPEHLIELRDRFGLLRQNRRVRPRRSRSSSRTAPTWSRTVWSPVSPGRAATSRASASSPSS
jgi:SAM-dependent methyltransferase